MDPQPRPPPSRPRPRSSTAQSPFITQYLILYNLFSALLWTTVLGRVLLLIPLTGFGGVYGGVGEFAKWTQTVAVLEVGHSAAGIVRSPLPTTLLQVFSRLLLVWGIVDTYPDATSHSPFYSSMLIAWSISEIVRYSYFVFNLRRGRSISIGGGSGAGGLSSNSGRGSPKEVVEDVPALLTWARYNFFYVLYPLGIGSEMALIWKASEEVAGAQSSLSSSSIWWRWVLWGVLGGYIPGSYILYTHMITQRRKLIRGKQPERRRD